MKRLSTSLAILALAFAPVTAAHAANLDIPKQILEISQPGDLDLTCHQISQEVMTMNDVVSIAQEIQNSSKVTTAGVSVAKAVGSYLIGSLVGGIGIIAAGYLVSEATDDRAEDAFITQNAALQRSSFMAGIYNAKGCEGPLEIASIEPAAGKEEPLQKKTVETRYSYND